MKKIDCPKCNGKILNNRPDYWCCNKCDLRLVEHTKSKYEKLKKEVADLRMCLRLIKRSMNKGLKEEGIFTIEI